MPNRMFTFKTGRFISVLLILLAICINCEKPERMVQVQTEKEALNISYTSVTLKGEVTDLGSKQIDDHGIMISENSNPRIGNARIESLGPLTSKGPFELTITGLTKNTLYYFRAFVTVDGTDIFSEQTYSFRTKDTETASISTGVLSDTTMVSARLTGEVTADGGEAVSKRGLVWSLSADPSLTSFLDTTINGSGMGSFTSTMTGLTPGTEYHVRAYATNAKGTSYSTTDIVFTTHKLPVVTTAIVTNVTNTSAASGGEVTDEGGVPVLARGIVWSSSSAPIITLTTKTENGKGTGSFVSGISGLTPGINYFVRAYATNRYGTSYGNEVQVTSTKPSDATTLAATIIGNTVAALNGSVNANNFSSAVSFEYGTTTSYGTTVDANPKTVTGSSATSVSADISGLAPGTEYHFRIRSVNAGGESLGGDMTFRTTDSPIPVTLAATSVGNTSAALNGSVNANNSETSVSFEYGLTTAYGSSITATPSTISGNTSTTVAAALTGLTQGTIYHYRVRAISVGGISYGEDITFRTTQPPDAITNDATSILNNGAILNGSVNANDLETAITFEYGISTAYGTSVPASPGSLNGSTATDVVATLSGLEVGTQYHYRVKAVSTGGKSYGSDQVFTTLQPPSATTSPVSVITNISATLNGTVSANGNSTTVTFEYGLTTSYGFSTTANQSPVTGQSAPVSSVISGLTPGATYHFRVVAVSAGGTTKGNDKTLTTTEPPTAVSGVATSIDMSIVTLNGTVNAKGLSTIVIFEFGTTASYGQTTLAAESPVIGSTNTTVSAALSSLTASTTYHYRVKAISAAGTVYGDDATFRTTDLPVTVTDNDGNVYNTVQIGSQLWFGKNLETNHYSDGSTIYLSTTPPDFNSIFSEPKMCYYEDDITYRSVYGALYNGFAANDVRNICPTGWHVSTDEEWTVLENFLGGSDIAGSKITASKSNETGFSALYAGSRTQNYGNVISYRLGEDGVWWTISREGMFRSIWYGNSIIYRSNMWNYFGMSNGFSVRCVYGPFPLTETSAPTSLTSTSVNLNGIVNPNSVLTAVTFEYGTTTGYGDVLNAIQSPIGGNLPVNVNTTITGLTPGTIYHYRIKAVNSGGTSYGSDMTFTTLPLTAEDIDGNLYNLVKLGPQTWFKENLKTTKLNDGTPIPQILDDTEWTNLATPGYCWYVNNYSSYGSTYGALYNWYALSAGKLCPLGWHVPTDEEWSSLEIYLENNGYNYDDYLDTDLDRSTNNKIAKSISAASAIWNSTSTPGAVGNTDFPAKRDVTGFTALPGGYRMGGFYKVNEYGHWWSSTIDVSNVFSRRISYAWGNIERPSISKYVGLSVRCLKD